jgi:hypothetical protein
MKKIYLSLMFLFPVIVFAQTIKTGTLVVGNNNTAFAAGVQANLSNVNTTVLTLGEGFKIDNIEGKSLNGVIIEFNKRAKKAFKLADTAKLPQLNYQSINAVLKNWSDSSKNFKVINNTTISEISRSGKGWYVKLSDGKAIKAKALVMASQSAQLLKSLKITELNVPIGKAFTYEDNNYRNAVLGINDKIFTLYDMLAADQENLIYIEENSLELGQTAGAIASYSAFFDTKTSLANLRLIQAELLKFKSPILPFDDVLLSDSSWTAIQKTAVTGLLKAEIIEGKMVFNPEKIVTLDEIQQSLKDYYYKANIWIEDNKGKPFDLETAISLVATLGNKSAEVTKNTLEKGWNKTYKFKSKFDLKKTVTRREFALLASDFLQIFDQSHIDKTGNIVR